jgi:hypothetical protein
MKARIRVRKLTFCLPLFRARNTQSLPIVVRVGVCSRIYTQEAWNDRREKADTLPDDGFRSSGLANLWDRGGVELCSCLVSMCSTCAGTPVLAAGSTPVAVETDLMYMQACVEYGMRI